MSGDRAEQAGPVADPEQPTPTAPRPAGRTVSTQSWRDLAFLHRAVDPALVAPLLPAGTTPDLLDEASYVGLIPFRMHRIGFLGAPGLPWLGSFPETNVRLYSVDALGRRGVVFRSLEAGRLLSVLAARWTARRPCTWAGMDVTRDGDVLSYTSARRWPGPRGAHSRVRVQVGERLPGGDPLGQFRTARWGLHRSGRRGPVHWPDEHAEWPLHRAELLEVDESLLAAAGLPGVTGAPGHRTACCSPPGWRCGSGRR